MTSAFSSRWTALAIFLLWAGWAGPNCAAEEVERKNERLGFKFDPQAHEAAVDNTAKVTAGSSLEELEAASPADDIFHLSKVVVTGKRIPFNERDVLTAAGRLDVAKKTYLTPAYEKTFGPLGTLASYYFNFLAVFGGWHPNDADALALYADADQKRRNIEMNSLLEVAVFGRPVSNEDQLAKPVKKSGWGLMVPHLSTP
jgi:hypothetical protein